MAEKLFPLDFPPGLANNGTTLQSRNRWFTGSLVRFYQGTVQPIGGWVARTLTGAAITGTTRTAISWQLDDGTSYLAVATEGKIYAITNGNVVTDLVPITYNASGATWQLATFGSYLVGVHHQGDLQSGEFLYIWRGNVAVVGEQITSSAAPISGFGVVVTPERFLVVLRGTNADVTEGTTVTAGGTYSVRRVMWASQETSSIWTASATNTAGTFELATEGALMCGKPSKGQTLLWTTRDMWTMQYIGGDLVYSFNRAGDNCGIISEYAAVVLDGTALWMGYGKFFEYDGYVRTIPCDVADYVFGNFSNTYARKVWALANPQFGEVTWFYVSSLATECDRYVTYNYLEKHWTFGLLARTCGVTQQANATNPVPVMVSSTGTVYDHETGNVRTGSTAFLESGPMQLGDGDNVLRVQRIIPDDETLGDVTASLYTSLYPDAAETLNGPYTLSATTSVRLTARQVRLRLTEAAASSWRVGLIRLGAILGGRR